MMPSNSQPALSPADRRQRFCGELASGRLLRMPGAFSPLVAMLVERLGFEGVYVSGGALSANMGMPDIGLTTLTEIATQAGAIASSTSLPTIVDADTGFGEPANVARTVRALEGSGACGIHLEDQTMPKRCGHLDSKELVSTDAMTRKIRAACAAKIDPNFLLIARTDARAVEGMDAAIDRAKCYLDAGAEMIFPEALTSESEFEAFRKAIPSPLLANMTEFGKSPLLSTDQLTQLGYNVAIYPVTSLRLAMRAIETGLKELADVGVQQGVVPQMQSRQELYDLLQYDVYAKQDRNLSEFKS